MELFLDDIWSKREKSNYFLNEEEKREEEQRFVQFLHKSSQLKSNKYVGVIHFEGNTINLLPKIFFEGSSKISDNQLHVINRHILWWLSYCSKIKFPNYLTGLDSDASDFFEILIYLFSKYTKEILSSSMYQRYIEVENELSNVKGRIDFNAYINNNLASGRHHKVSCVYDSFELDNEFNQCVKCVAKMLSIATKNAESRRHLEDILFLLDEVSDVQVSSTTCRNISFNMMFADFEAIRDYCTLFLENSVSFNYKNEMKLFAFLLPMEYIFEDFILGFLNTEVVGVSAKGQSTKKHLDEGLKFQLRPDLLLETNSGSFIADAKYKMVFNTSDGKNGLSQSDLYQMLAYSVRFEIPNIKLFFPGTIHLSTSESKGITVINDEFSKSSIFVDAHQLKIIDTAKYKDCEENCDVQFTDLRDELAAYFSAILF